MFDPPVYDELSNDEVQAQYDALYEQWEQFLKDNGLKLQLGVDFFVHKRNVFEIIRRCDKRRVYYKMFHNLPFICEYKAVAIRCFWINSLKPFMVINENTDIYNCPNEMFSLYLIFSTIRAEFHKIYPDKKFEYPCSERIKDIVYDFKYCGLNREAMISFVETLADNYGVGINYILENNAGK